MMGAAAHRRRPHRTERHRQGAHVALEAAAALLSIVAVCILAVHGWGAASGLLLRPRGLGCSSLLLKRLPLHVSMLCARYWMTGDALTERRCANLAVCAAAAAASPGGRCQRGGAPVLPSLWARLAGGAHTTSAVLQPAEKRADDKPRAAGEHRRRDARPAPRRRPPLYRPRRGDRPCARRRSVMMPCSIPRCMGTTHLTDPHRAAENLTCFYHTGIKRREARPPTASNAAALGTALGPGRLQHAAASPGVPKGMPGGDSSHILGPGCLFHHCAHAPCLNVNAHPLARPRTPPPT